MGVAIAVAVFAALLPTRMASAVDVVWIDQRLLSQSGLAPDILGEEIPVVMVGSSSFTREQIGKISAVGKLGTVVDNIATVRLPLSLVPHVAQFGFLSRIEMGYAAPTLDLSVPEIGATAVWEKIAESNGLHLNGTGVIVGIVDTGIDWKHPDFKFENGSSKIQYLWDQTRSGAPPVGYSYGTEWTRLQIDAGMCDSKDTVGHGTHVAGIASGTGWSRGKYIGVALGSTLVVVKSGVLTRKGWRFRWGEVIDGVNYIWQKAKALGKRAVVNLSLGSNAGGHDGSSSIEKALDHFVAEGLPVVVSAGNDGESRTHAEGKLREEESDTLIVQPSTDEDEIYLEVWHSNSNVMDISVKAPDGRVINGSTPPEGILTPSGTIRLGYDTSEKGKALKLWVTSPTNLTSDNWMVTIHGRSVTDEGEWDAWLSTKGRFLAGAGYEITRRKTVSVPGTARNVITVGAYVTRMKWITKNGIEQRYTTEESVGELASFSSWGPTRDGRLKPEITAPGKGIISARSKDSPSSERDPDEAYSIKQGTSMAAPHITGAIALIMQSNPNASPATIKEILKMTARQDLDTGKIDPSGSHEWGFGKLDANKAVAISTAKYPVKLLLAGISSPIPVEVKIDGTTRTLTAKETATIFEVYAGNTLAIFVMRAIPEGSSHWMLLYRKTSRYVLDRWRVQSYDLDAVFPANETITVVVNGAKTIIAEWKEQTEIELDWLTFAVASSAMCLLVAAFVTVAAKSGLKIVGPSSLSQR
jgi:subtilisin family serine protease